MGLKTPDLPDDYDWGDDCLACHDIGKTPNMVFVRFIGVDACAAELDPPNGIAFVCRQDNVNPCKYAGFVNFSGIEWTCQYISSVSEVQLFQSDPPFKHYFYALGAPCAVDFPVNADECEHWSGVNGSCNVTVYIDPIIIFLTSHWHMVTEPDTFHEWFECGIDHKVYRLASRFDNTNVLFLIDDEEVVPGWQEQ